MMLHTGSHVDFSRHCAEGGETAADVSLDRTCGQAIVIDLTFLGEDEPITVALLEEHAPPIEEGDVALVPHRLDREVLGPVPRLLPALALLRAGGRGLARRAGREGRRASTASASGRRASPDFTSEDFVVHKAILDRGAILIQQLTGLSQLPVGVRVPFFAGCVPIRGAEGSPGRMFALVD